MTTTLATDYIVASEITWPAQRPPMPILHLTGGTPIMGDFDLDNRPLCIDTEVGDWQIGAGGDGGFNFVHRHFPITIDIDIAQLRILRESLQALVKVLDSDLIALLASVAQAWDDGDILTTD